MNEIKFKLPIELIVGPKASSGGLYCSVARTLDGGAASVIWDFETKSWVFAKGLSVGTVFAAVPLSPEFMEKSGIAESKPYLDFVAELKNK